MKHLFRILPIVMVTFLMTSCTSVRVASDYDKEADFNSYKTFAFYKTGVDKAEISDLDKRRILRAIEAELLSKGFTKSENPDVLVSIFTKSKERINVYNNNWGFGGWGWGGFGPGWGLNNQSVSTRTEGSLFIDLIDANKKELVWQGIGRGYISENMKQKEERIKEFVMKILERYPPGIEQ